MELSIGHIELFVSDPAASRDWYVSRLGCSVVDEQGPEGEPPRYIWLQLSGTELLLRPGRPRQPVPSYQDAALGIVLYTPTLDATIAELTKRGLEFNGEDTGCPCFSDPDGHWFQLVDPAEHT